MPQPKVRRSESVDVVRGVALFGVALVNLHTLFRVPILAWLTRFHTHDGALNHALDWAIGHVAAPAQKMQPPRR